jgi:hypothetical protein
LSRKVCSTGCANNRKETKYDRSTIGELRSPAHTHTHTLSVAREPLAKDELSVDNK